MKEDAKRREQNNPMKVCVLKFDHFENIHRLDAKLPSYEGAPNFRQVTRVVVDSVLHSPWSRLGLLVERIIVSALICQKDLART